MKDRQVITQGTPHSIPIISPLLHWLAMPAIVFLRSSFGYSFLSPKSVFLAFSWAALLFVIYTGIEPGAWRSNWALASFAGMASLLYILHLATAFARETQRKGKHDFYSGTSHLLRLPGFNQNRGNASFETMLHLWGEPLALFIAATALRGFLGEQRLSFWLVVVAAALWLKEFVNYWYSLRSEKKHEDIIEDAEEKMRAGPIAGQSPLPSAAGRKSRIKRPAGNSDQTSEGRFAELLRLMPPYSLEQAEANYRALMLRQHPDANNATAESSVKAAELNEAIEYFRRAFGE